MTANKPSPQQPNILVIVSDQQRRDSLGCYGNDWIEAPALNALADRSYVFENAYVMQAVCTPARATLMTGLYPHSAKVVRNSQPGRFMSNLPADVKTIAEMAPEEYVCAKFGKWHLGDDLIPQHGFEEWVSTEDAHDANYPNFQTREGRFKQSDYFHYLVENGYEPEGESNGHFSHTQTQRGFLPEEHTMASFLGRRAGDFIRKQADSDRPFLMYLTMFEPHPPYNGPLNDLYDPDSIPDGPLLNTQPAANTPLFSRLRSDQHTAEAEATGDATKYWRELRARYYGNVTVLDRAVATALQALEESGQAENTVVVFTTDHGDSLGDRGMINKRSFYEEVSRVPCMIAVPWMSDQQHRVNGNFGQVDIVPTLLDLMGVEAPDHLQGQSVVPDLEGERQLERDVFMQWHGGAATVPLGGAAISQMSTVPWRSVVSGDRWKLNLSPGDQCELYDLNTDPLELTNLFDAPEHRDQVRDLAARIRIWQAETEDDLALPAV